MPSRAADMYSSLHLGNRRLSAKSQRVESNPCTKFLRLPIYVGEEVSFDEVKTSRSQSKGNTFGMLSSTQVPGPGAYSVPATLKV